MTVRLFAPMKHPYLWDELWEPIWSVKLRVRSTKLWQQT